MVPTVLVPLFDYHARHWLLLQVDLRRRCVCVRFLPPSKAKDKHERKMLVDRVVKISSLKVVVALAVMKTDIYTNALMWDLIHVDFPQQDKYVMNFHLHIWYALCLISSNTNIPTMIWFYSGHDCGVFVMIFMDILALTLSAVVRCVVLLPIIDALHCEELCQFTYLCVHHLLLSCLPGHV
ncbi:hypothetical protein Cgig2_015834 [Carnegiea gigantea]|uniref:Ubiquitin-like protease family profile domain-containing protein n=1 Tax=Carnegiea gigantea TaxID=171969 RepID=A0A9Q1QI22_9CARY|nr:hypothetical protein Cgig2_015834 [Carnegiea gigantea]